MKYLKAAIYEIYLIHLRQLVRIYYQNNDNIYTLHSIVGYYGSHYFSFIKIPYSSQENSSQGKWKVFDDAFVKVFKMIFYHNYYIYFISLNLKLLLI